MIKLSEMERLELRHIIRSKSVKGPRGCLLWSGAVSASGYGNQSWKRKTQKAHRLAYLAFKSVIPKGYEIDHLCRVRHCVNPTHLEAVTKTENILRGISFSAVNARKTECVNGHPFVEANIKVHTDGYRRCKECARVQNNRLYSRRGDELRSKRRKRYAELRLAALDGGTDGKT